MSEENLSVDDVKEFLGDDVSDDILSDFEDVEDEKEEPETEEVEIEEAEEEKEEEESTEEDEEEKEPEGIESKSGKYTIPYEKLVEAREAKAAALENEQKALEKVNDLKAELDKLLTKNDDVKADKTEELDADDLKDLKEEFPSVYKMLFALNEQVTSLRESSEKLMNNSVDRDTENHFSTIESVHEHSQEILQSQEFADWMEGHSDIIHDAYVDVYTDGTSAQVIEMISDFKAATKEPEVPEVPKVDIADKVKEAKEKKAVPNSLSDVPGEEAVTDLSEKLTAAGNSGKTVDSMFAGKSDEEIEKILSKVM